MGDRKPPSALVAIESALRKQMLQPSGSTWYAVTAQMALDALSEAGYTLMRHIRSEPDKCDYCGCDRNAEGMCEWCDLDEQPTANAPSAEEI
ncbi:MAG: hypothetical protein NVS3B1_29580 [Marmoricola sp.]